MLYLRGELDRATELDLLLVSVLSNDDHFVVLFQHVTTAQCPTRVRRTLHMYRYIPLVAKSEQKIK